MQSTSDARVKENEKTYQTKIEQFEEKINALSSDLADQKQGRLNAENSLTQLRAEHDKLTGIKDKHERELEHATLQINNQAQRLTDKDAAIELLKVQLNHVNENLDHYREAAKEQREAEALKHSEVVNQLKLEIQSLKANLDQALDKTNGVIIELEKQKYANEIIIAESHLLKEQLSAKSEQLAETKAEIKALQKSNTEVSQHRDALLERNEHQIIELTELRHFKTNSENELKRSHANQRQLEMANDNLTKQIAELCN